MQRLALLVALFLSGCMGAAAPNVLPQTTPADAPPAAEAPPAAAPVRFTLATHDLGPSQLGAEPSIEIAPDGTIYVATPPFLWRSLDGGHSFEPVGTPSCLLVLFAPGSYPACPLLDWHDAGARGMGDVDIAVDDAGTLHWVALHEGAIVYQRSSDRGETWTDPVDLAEGRPVDRPWALAANGALHVGWLEQGDPRSIRTIRSLDGGLTWSAPAQAGPYGTPGPIARGRDALLFPHVADGAVALALSRDEGASWSRVEVAGIEAAVSIFPVAAQDARGRLHVVFATDPDAPLAHRDLATPSVWRAVSDDEGETWSKPERLSTPAHSAIFPWIAADDAGRVAIAWYEERLGTGGDVLPGLWDVKLAYSHDAGDTFDTRDVNERPIHVGAMCTRGGPCRTEGRDRSLLDFFELTLDPNGMPALAWAADPPQLRGRVHVHAAVGVPHR